MTARNDNGASDADASKRRELVDTRGATGPDGRTYAIPFADVWDAVAARVAAQRGWELVHADEERGLFTIVCRSRLRRSVDDLSIWVRLDEDGLTRLDVRAGSREGRQTPGANRKRVTELLQALDDALGPGARVIRPGGTGRERPSGP